MARKVVVTLNLDPDLDQHISKIAGAFGWSREKFIEEIMRAVVFSQGSRVKFDREFAGYFVQQFWKDYVRASQGKK